METLNTKAEETVHYKRLKHFQEKKSLLQLFIGHPTPCDSNKGKWFKKMGQDR